MKRALRFLLGVAVLSPLFFSTAFSLKAYGEATDATIASRTADINGVKLHYLTAGHGTPLILLHGYAETSRMWRPIIPQLAERFTVIAPDLPGIGDSDIPADGLDMKSAAIRIHDLAKSLGVQKAEVVGHDIGLMVAYAYAAQFPSEVDETRSDGCFPSGRGRLGGDLQQPEYLALPLQWADARGSGCKAANVPTSTISGMISRPTKLVRFRKQIAKLTPRPTRGRDGCTRAGPISFPSCKPPRISINFPRPS